VGGTDIAFTQYLLEKHFNLREGSITTGVLTKETQGYLKRFQSKNKLAALGIIGPSTKKALARACNALVGKKKSASVKPILGSIRQTHDAYAQVDASWYADILNYTEGEQYEWFWSWGDGTPVEGNKNRNIHQYTRSGTYEISVYVKNEQGSMSDTQRFTAVVLPTPAVSITASLETSTRAFKVGEKLPILLRTSDNAHAMNIKLLLERSDTKELFEIVDYTFPNLNPISYEIRSSSIEDESRPIVPGEYRVKAVLYSKSVPEFVSGYTTTFTIQEGKVPVVQEDDASLIAKMDASKCFLRYPRQKDSVFIDGEYPPENVAQADESTCIDWCKKAKAFRGVTFISQCIYTKSDGQKSYNSI
jgi:hypothetical protein